MRPEKRGRGGTWEPICPASEASVLGDSDVSNKGSFWKDEVRLPLALGIFVVLLAITGFAEGVRTLPTWVQASLGFILLTTLFLLILTNRLDPGVLQPSDLVDRTVLNLEDGVSDIPERQMYKKDRRGQWMRPALNGSGWERYCTTCNIWRSPRASHCNVCGYCIERFDHHCEVMGNCIGRNNHRFFVLFLFSGQVGCAVLAAGSSYRLHLMGFPSERLWQRPETYILLLLAIVYAYMTFMLMFGLFHCCSIACDITTKELTVGHPRRGKGFCSLKNLQQVVQSWSWVCCAPVSRRRATRARQLILVNTSDLPEPPV